MNGDKVSARGERAAIGGYLPQFDAFAWFAYRELLNENLDWIRVADPKAEKLDDIQYSTSTEIHAYQVKWSTADARFSYANFKELLPLIASSWQKLKTFHSAENKKLIAHLLTNKPLSVDDSINQEQIKIGSFSDFFNQVWIPLKSNQEVIPKWNETLKELRAISKLDETDFLDFIKHFELHPNYDPEKFTVNNISRNKRDEDLLSLRSFLLEKVADARRPVEFSKSEILISLGWEARFKTTFNHELVVDKSKYQPIQDSIDELNNKLLINNEGYIFLIGGPGTGKSTLLTQWSKTRQENIIRYYAFDFTNPSSSQNYHERGEAANLLFDLVIQIKNLGIFKESVLPYKDLTYLKAIFYKQLNALGEEFSKTNKKTFIIIDGLDHISREYKTVFKNLLADLPFPASIPEGVYIILGSQTYNLDYLSQEIKSEWQKSNRSITISSLNKQEVVKFIDSSNITPPLSAEQKQVVFEKSDGHPLYLSYLVEKIRGNIFEDIISDFTPIDGNIYSYYKNIWQPIQNNAGLIELLGLIARINGSTQPQFIKEWGLNPQVLIDFRDKAKFLFDESKSGWRFFHNSFRQFLLQHTAEDYLTETYNSEEDQAFHRKLASFYDNSRVEPLWKKLYHLYNAGEFEAFLKEASPENFKNQLLDYRPAEEIQQDIKLGIEIANKTKDVYALVRYLFVLAELKTRLYNIDPASFTEDFLMLGKNQVAKNYLRNGKSLLCSKTFALEAAKHFIDFNDKIEGKILYTLAEPESIKEGKIKIDNSHQFRETKKELENWVVIAPYFRQASEIINLLNNIEFNEDEKQGVYEETKPDFKLSLLLKLSTGLIYNNKWDDVKQVLSEFQLEKKKYRGYYFQIIKEAIEECLTVQDFIQANKWLTLFLEEADKAKTNLGGRILVADLIYRVVGDIELAKEWIKDVPQPSLSNFDSFRHEDTLDAFLPRINLNKLLNIAGKGVSIIEAVPTAKPGANEEILVEFERMLCLITQLLSDGLQNKPFFGNILIRCQPIIKFYYKEVSHRNTYWYKLTQRKAEYYGFLIYAVATLSQEALAQLGQKLLEDFINFSTYWPSDVQRKVVISMVELGFEIERAKEQLHLIESFMLEGKDIHGRVRECMTQANAWIKFAENDIAEKWIKKALEESVGIGYRKDYQFSTWIEWLDKINKTEPSKAGERITWLLSHLRHIKNSTEGRAYWNSSEELLQTAFNWNFSAGLQQLKWQLDNGLIDFEDSVAVFLKSYIHLINTQDEYSKIVYLYIELFLYIAEDSWTDILEIILRKGYELSKKQFLQDVLPVIIDAISIKGLEEKRSNLLHTVNAFAKGNNIEIIDYYPDFIPPMDSKDDDSAKSSNTLRLISDSKSLSEEEVLNRINSVDDFKELLALEDKFNSHFNWEKAIKKLLPSLSIQQRKELSSIKQTNRRGSDFYTSLSESALTLGDKALAYELAEMAVACSNDYGWNRWYDGGSRINSFKALKQANNDRATQLAFEVFSHNLISDTNPITLATELDEILPIISNDFDIIRIWDEIFIYLQQLMANSKPEDNLPNLQANDDSIGVNLNSFLIYLSQSRVSLINERAKKLIGININLSDIYDIKSVQGLANGSEHEQETFIDVLMLLLSLKSKQIKSFSKELFLLALSNNYSIRTNATSLLKSINEEVPTHSKRILHGFYSLHVGSSGKKIETEKKWFETNDNPDNPEDLIRPFGSWVDILAKHSGIAKSALVYRMNSIMKDLDNPENWQGSFDKKVIGHHEAIRLRYSSPFQRVVIARRALMHLTTELIDSESMAESGIKQLMVNYDYDVPFLKEIEKPFFVSKLGEREYSSVKEDWVDRINDNLRLNEPLLVWKHNWKIIGEFSLIRSLYWGTPTETYMAQLATGEDKEEDDDLYIFGSAFQQLTKDYYKMNVAGPHIIVIRNHRFNQFYTKSNWLAVNPLLARYLGWQPDYTKLFCWKDSSGTSMAESIFWSNGNVNMQPPHLHSESGDGWFVIASLEAINQIENVIGELFIDKKILRTNNLDNNFQENSAIMKYKYK